MGDRSIRRLAGMISVLMAGTLLSASADAGTILTSTMDATNDAWTGFTNTNWIAAPFQTTATLTRITAISLGLQDIGGYAGGDFFVEIKESVAGAAGPGGFTGPGGSTWSVFSGSFTGGTMTFTGLSLNLLPNSQYFVVVGGASLNASGGFRPRPGSIAWDVLYAPTPHTGDGFVEGTWFGSDYSTQWNPSTTYSPLMSITAEASSAVPEIDPAGAGSVLSLVAVALAMLERRRRA